VVEKQAALSVPNPSALAAVTAPPSPGHTVARELRRSPRRAEAVQNLQDLSPNSQMRAMGFLYQRAGDADDLDKEVEALGK